MKLPLYHVDAFTDRVFSGNPAAICPLNKWLDDQTMLAIAAENNLSETAFCVREGEQYGLRWFAPKSEVQLCGHATLATGFVVLNYLQPGATTVTFQTCSGLLSVKQDGEFLAMDLPLIPARPCSAPPDLISGLNPRTASSVGVRRKRGRSKLLRGIRQRGRSSECETRPIPTREIASRRRLHHGTGTPIRLRLPLLRAQLRNSGRSCYGFHALHPGVLLGRATRKEGSTWTTSFRARRRPDR